MMNSPFSSGAWSDDLKARTLEAIGDHYVLASRDGHLHLKHTTFAFGSIASGDLRRDVLRVVDKRSGATITFANADALVADGWAID
jgi:hypothetical protein